MFKKVCVLMFCLLLVLPALADDIYLLAKFPNAGYYYFSASNIDIENFKMPEEVTKSEYDEYRLFVYDGAISPDEFIYYDRVENRNYIEDDSSQMFSFLLNGMKNHPTYYIYQSEDYEDIGVEKYICKFDKDNTQTRYIFDKTTNKYVKEKTFNYGELNLRNLCDPDYIPGYDV